MNKQTAAWTERENITQEDQDGYPDGQMDRQIV